MILVVGDFILDEYVYGRVDRISPEAPVPVVDYSRSELRPGGAGNVAANVASLGSDVVMVGVAGDDVNDIPKESDWYLFHDPRPTTRKTRIVSGGHQIVRLDRESRAPISGSTEQFVVEFIRIARNDASVIVVSDYGKGVITPNVMRAIFAADPKVPVVVDPGRPDYSLYDGARLLTPNLREYEQHLSQDSVPVLANPGPALLVTQGELGMTLYERGQVTTIPAMAKSVIDVTGAGDTVIAAIANYMERNPSASLANAARFANAAASVVVSKAGTATVTPEEIPEWG